MIGGVEILLLVLLASWVGVWVLSLYEIVATPSSRWIAVRESKTTWFLLVLVLQFFGTLVYLISVRPKLQNGAGERPA